jgi:ribosomal protein L16 Arg81 hydroxylase
LLRVVLKHLTAEKTALAALAHDHDARLVHHGHTWHWLVGPHQADTFQTRVRETGIGREHVEQFDQTLLDRIGRGALDRVAFGRYGFDRTG